MYLIQKKIHGGLIFAHYLHLSDLRLFRCNDAHIYLLNGFLLASLFFFYTTVI